MLKFSKEDLSLVYERYGRGAPLVLLHGYPLDHTIWEEVVPHLESDFDLILPDLRGLGQSLGMEGDYTITDLAHDIASLLDHLRIDAAFIAGHSMGGYVALAFAGAHPHRMRGLALVASQAAADSPERKAGRYATIEQIKEKGIGVVVEAMTPKLSSDAWVQKYVRRLMEKQSATGMIGSLKAMAERVDTLNVLETGSFPVLIIHGGADALIPIQREIPLKVPRARAVELPKAGHMPMMEFPREVAEALKNFAR